MRAPTPGRPVEPLGRRGRAGPVFECSNSQPCDASHFRPTAFPCQAENNLLKCKWYRILGAVYRQAEEGIARLADDKLSFQRRTPKAAQVQDYRIELIRKAAGRSAEIDAR